MIYDHWLDYPESQWRWSSFSRAEMACKGTGRLMVDDSAMDALQSLREEIGRPFIVHSAYRSPEHNKRVGGAKASKHMQAIAFDISMGNHDPAAFMAIAERHGFNGIGTYPKSNFMHIDHRSSRARWGKPFLQRDNRFDQEPVVVEREISKADTTGTAKGAGGAVLGGVALDVVANGGGFMRAMSDMNPIVQGIVAVAVIAVVGFLVWKRSERGTG